MTATLAEKLTVTQFERRYGQEKPYYEFWYGQAIQKSTPTWIHGLLQKILMDLLSAGGYKAGSEVKLKIDPELQPIPDVIATRGQIELPYPTKPLEIVIEILSDDDPHVPKSNEVQNVPKLGLRAGLRCRSGDSPCIPLGGSQAGRSEHACFRGR
jgi:Uma2 family endonuclease